MNEKLLAEFTEKIKTVSEKRGITVEKLIEEVFEVIEKEATPKPRRIRITSAEPNNSGFDGTFSERDSASFIHDFLKLSPTLIHFDFRTKEETRELIDVIRKHQQEG
jgi:hypothetical protein